MQYALIELLRSLALNLHLETQISSESINGRFECHILEHRLEISSLSLRAVGYVFRRLNAIILLNSQKALLQAGLEIGRSLK